MITDEEIAEAIEDGADYIETYGWHQGDLYDWQAVGEVPNPPACMMGGITSGLLKSNKQHIPAGVVCGRFLAVTEMASMSVWNDTVAKDVQEVLDLMREVAKQLRMGVS